jgi:hypothetical protein
MIGSIVVLLGCVPTHTYEVVVKNRSATPVTVWLTKNGPPVENRWKSPEDYAIERPGGNERVSGVIIAPGQEGATGKVSGRFPPQTDAVLRVYVGEHGVTDLLAISRGSPNRIDVTLNPGMNDLVVLDRGGRTIVEASPGAPGGSR